MYLSSWLLLLRIKHKLEVQSLSPSLQHASIKSSSTCDQGAHASFLDLLLTINSGCSGRSSREHAPVTPPDRTEFLLDEVDLGRRYELDGVAVFLGRCSVGTGVSFLSLCQCSTVVHIQAICLFHTGSLARIVLVVLPSWCFSVCLCRIFGFRDFSSPPPGDFFGAAIFVVGVWRLRSLAFLRCRCRGASLLWWWRGFCAGLGGSRGRA